MAARWVVESADIDPDPAVPARLLVVQGWGRQRTTVSVDDVIEVAPGERRLVIKCRAGHRTPQVDRPTQGQGGPPDTGWTVQVAGGATNRSPN